MEDPNIHTPARASHSRSRSILGEISLSGARFNVSSPIEKDKHRATAAAANRLKDFNRGIPRSSTDRRRLSTASGPQHGRQPSRSARYRFLQRAATSDGEYASDSNSMATREVRLDLGDSGHPIIHFRPQLWRHLEPTRDTLDLDLFWPQRSEGSGEREEEEEEDSNDGNQDDASIFPSQGLLPLCEFRNLRSLRLGGMLQSYQAYIWRTCWLNPGLEELVLEMALEPTIDEVNRSWTPICGPWRMRTVSEACTDYLGEQEHGALCGSTGTGEYLDKHAMASARSFVSSQGVNLRYLPIVKLVLAGFVVDAGPFFRWFNPMRLRQIEFKYGCIDAGFALPSHMTNLVTVTWPGKLPWKTQMVAVSRIRQQDIKTVRIKSKPTSSSQPNGLMAPVSSVLAMNWFSSTRGHSLKAWRANRSRQQHAGRTSGASSSGDLGLFRQNSSSGISWTSQHSVAL